MKILLTLTLLFSSISEAGSLVAVYKNKNAPVEYRYLGVFKNTLGSSSYVVAFGQGTENLVFNTGYLFRTSPGALNTGNNESFKIIVEGIKQDSSLSATITDLKGNVITNGKYIRHQSLKSLNFAKNIDKIVEANFNRYRKMENPSTTAELRQIFRQLEQDLAGDGDDDNFELPTYDLQIEYSLQILGPNSKLAKTTISKDQSDAYSKEFLKGRSEWFTTNGEANTALTNSLEKYAGSEEDPTFQQSYVSYSRSVQVSGISNRLVKALEKHLKYEILEEGGFNCEDSVYTWTTATWVLSDGSQIVYSPGTECD